MATKKKGIKEVFQEITDKKNEEATKQIKKTKQKFGVPSASEKELLGLADLFKDEDKLM